MKTYETRHTEERVYPLVSVICTCHNESARDIERSLISVLKQDYSNIELIVIDDASRMPFNNVNDIIQDSNLIQWIELSKNVGVASARNRGIRHATGQYICFLDAGDWWDEHKISSQIEYFVENRERNIGLVYCGAQFHQANGHTRKCIAKHGGDLVNELLVRQPLCGSASSVMLRSDVFATVGVFYEKEDIPEDQEYWLRIALHYQIGNVDSCCVHIVCASNSRSSSADIKAITYMRFLNMYESLIRQRGLWRPAIAHYHVVIGKKYWAAGQYRQVVKHTLLGLASYPSFIVRGVIKRINRAFTKT